MRSADPHPHTHATGVPGAPWAASWRQQDDGTHAARVTAARCRQQRPEFAGLPAGRRVSGDAPCGDVSSLHGSLLQPAAAAVHTRAVAAFTSGVTTCCPVLVATLPGVMARILRRRAAGDGGRYWRSGLHFEKWACGAAAAAEALAGGPSTFSAALVRDSGSTARSSMSRGDGTL